MSNTDTAKGIGSRTLKINEFLNKIIEKGTKNKENGVKMSSLA